MWRPRRNVSNLLKISSKSISGSLMIQSLSPFGPAMYASKLIATAYRTRRIGASGENGACQWLRHNIIDRIRTH